MKEKFGDAAARIVSQATHRHTMNYYDWKYCRELADQILDLKIEGYKLEIVKE